MNCVAIHIYIIVVRFTYFQSYSLSLHPFAGKAGKGGSKGKKASPKRSLPTNGKIEQKDARKLLPPHTSLWQSRASGSWSVKVKPYKHSVSRSWRRYGQARALFLVIVEAWKLHCCATGIADSDCPMDGVFEECRALEGAGASSTDPA